MTARENSRRDDRNDREDAERDDPGETDGEPTRPKEPRQKMPARSPREKLAKTAKMEARESRRWGQDCDRTPLQALACYNGSLPCTAVDTAQNKTVEGVRLDASQETRSRRAPELGRGRLKGVGAKPGNAEVRDAKDGPASRIIPSKG